MVSKEKKTHKRIQLPNRKVLLLISFALCFLIISVLSYTLYLKILSKSKPEELDVVNTTQEQVKEEEKEEIGEFVLKIEKIGVEALVIRGVDPTDEEEYNKYLLNGVLHMTGTALPGEVGNVFIYGHSSSKDSRLYGRIFTDIYKLDSGDIIEVYFNNEYYFYEVFEQKVVEKTDLSVVKPTDEEVLSLMTCWPIDTDDQRMIVLAKRVMPGMVKK